MNMAGNQKEFEWKVMLCNRLHQLQLENKYCDVVIESSDGSEFPIHSYVLAAVCSSDIFPPNTKAPYLIKCPEASKEGMTQLVRFLYTGTFDEEIPCSISDELYTVAYNLDMKVATEALLPYTTQRKIIEEATAKADEDNSTEKERDNLSHFYDGEINPANHNIFIKDSEIKNNDVVEAEVLQSVEKIDCALNMDFDKDASVKLSDQVIADCQNTLNKERGLDHFESQVEIFERLGNFSTVAVKSKKDYPVSKKTHKFDPKVIKFLKGTTKKARSEKLPSIVKTEADDLVDKEEVVRVCLENEENCEPVEMFVTIFSSEVVIHGNCKVYRCGTCGKEYSGSTRAKVFFAKHKLSHQTAIIQCYICNCKFEEESELRLHMVEKHSQNNPKEENSDPVKNTNIPWDDLKSHVLKSEKLQSSNKKTFYKCSICNLEKTGFENFLAHKLRHADIVPFRCRHCNKEFYRKSDGQRHERKATCRSGQRTAYSFFKKEQDGSLKNYSFVKPEEIQFENERKYFKCSICERTMIGYETFVSHKFYHAGMKPYECKFCLREFVRKVEWRKHQSMSGCSHHYPEFSGNIDDQEHIVLGDIGDHNRQRIKKTLQILESTSHEVLMENLELAQAGMSKNEIFRGMEEYVDFDPGLKKKTSFKLSSKYSMENSKAARFSKIRQFIFPTEKILNGNATEYKCCICKVVFQKITQFALHKMRHLQIKPYKCIYCQRGFVKKWEFSAHLLTHKQSLENYRCKDCQQTFLTLLQQKKHYKINSICKIPEDLISHDKWKSGANQCHKCGKKYSTASYLQTHILSHSGRKLNCDLCGKHFILPANLAIHMMRHQGIKSYSCPVCSKKFVHNSDVRNHMKTHNNIPDFICSVCNKKFKHKHSLKLHLQIHNEEKPYVCDMCGKWFSQKGNLKKHQKETHATDHNFQCTSCDKKFYTEGGFKAHMKTHHTTERPYSCPICQKTFVMRINLSKHMNSHNNTVKSFACPICSKEFRLVSQLRRHLSNVHAANKKGHAATPATKVTPSNIQGAKPAATLSANSFAVISNGGGNLLYVAQPNGNTVLLSSEELSKAVVAQQKPAQLQIEEESFSNLPITSESHLSPPVTLACIKQINNDDEFTLPDKGNTSAAQSIQEDEQADFGYIELSNNETRYSDLSAAQQQNIIYVNSQGQELEMPSAYQRYPVTTEDMEVVQVQQEEIIDESDNVMESDHNNLSAMFGVMRGNFHQFDASGDENLQDQSYVLVYPSQCSDS